SRGRLLDGDAVLRLRDGRHLAGLGESLLLDVGELFALVRLLEFGVAARHAVVAAPVLALVGVVVVVVARLRRVVDDLMVAVAVVGGRRLVVVVTVVVAALLVPGPAVELAALGAHRGGAEQQQRQGEPDRFHAGHLVLLHGGMGRFSTGLLGPGARRET